jgi:hypothetical protein
MLSIMRENQGRQEHIMGRLRQKQKPPFIIALLGV